MESYKARAKEFLAEYVDELRRERQLTQEQMAERLHITCRAYGDLERGKYCFSAVALLFLLLMLGEDEIKGFLDKFRGEIAAPEEPAAEE